MAPVPLPPQLLPPAATGPARQLEPPAAELASATETARLPVKKSVPFGLGLGLSSIGLSIAQGAVRTHPVPTAKPHMPAPRQTSAAGANPHPAHPRLATAISTAAPQPLPNRAHPQGPIPAGMQHSAPNPWELQALPSFQRKGPMTGAPPSTPQTVGSPRWTVSAGTRLPPNRAWLSRGPGSEPGARPEDPNSKVLSDLEIFWDAEQGDLQEPAVLDAARQPAAAAAARLPAPRNGAGRGPRAALASPLLLSTEGMPLHKSPAPDSHMAAEGDQDSDMGDGEDSAGGELHAQANYRALPESLEVSCGHAKGTFMVKRMRVSCRCQLCRGKVRMDIHLLSTLCV